MKVFLKNSHLSLLPLSVQPGWGVGGCYSILQKIRNLFCGEDKLRILELKISGIAKDGNILLKMA